MNTQHTTSDEKYVEPPELREAGVPPLRKQINWITIAVGIIVLIVAAFAIYFVMH